MLSDTRARTLTIISRHGLANRLRMLISGLVLAKHTQRFFTMYWPRGKGCGCEWRALFTNTWNVLDAPAPEALSVLELAECDWRSFPDLVASAERELAVDYYGWLLQPARFAYHAAYMRECVEMFAQLELHPEIAARAAAFRQAFFRAPVIGVHLRRADMLRVHPDTTNNTHAALHAVARFLQDAPNALIFLCTDDGAVSHLNNTPTRREGAREEFIRQFGARVIFTQPRSLDRRTPEAIQDALLDLWLLRQTDYFVGTAFSSFSELAVFGRAIPNVMTAHPHAAYARVEQFLRATRLQVVIDHLNRREFGRAAPLTALWYRYRKRVLVTTRRIWRRVAQSPNPPIRHP